MGSSGSAAVSGAVSTHEADTTSVHGITDTSALVTSAAISAPSLLAPTAFSPTQTTNTWPGQYFTYWTRFSLPIARSYRYFCIRVGVQSGNVQFAVVRLSGAGLLSYTRVMNSGIIACPAAGSVRRDLGATALTAGEYAMVIWADNTTVTVPHGVAAPLPATRALFGDILTSAGIPASGSVSAWDGDRILGCVLEADV